MLLLVEMSMKIEAKTQNQQNISPNTLIIFSMEIPDVSTYKYPKKKKPGGIL